MVKIKPVKKKYQRELVTGDFELHFEEVVQRNRYTLLAIISCGLLLLGLLAPGVVNYSQADRGSIRIEAENGRLINQDKVEAFRSGEGNGYIMFKVP